MTIQTFGRSRGNWLQKCPIPPTCRWKSEFMTSSSSVAQLTFADNLESLFIPSENNEKSLRRDVLAWSLILHTLPLSSFVSCGGCPALSFLQSLICLVPCLDSHIHMDLENMLKPLEDQLKTQEQYRERVWVRRGLHSWFSCLSLSENFELKGYKRFPPFLAFSPINLPHWVKVRIFENICALFWSRLMYGMRAVAAPVARECASLRLRPAYFCCLRFLLLSTYRSERV